VVRPRPLAFPRDHGAHPEYRTEWWYLTGWLDAAPPLGFQITFFRTRTAIDPDNPSRFAAKQLVIAHAAIADPARGSLLKDEHIARAGFGIAEASETDTDLRLDRWRFARRADGSYECTLPARFCGRDEVLLLLVTYALFLPGTPTAPARRAWSRAGRLRGARGTAALPSSIRGGHWPRRA
jgi:predicted secreted hydrolase